MRVKGLLGSIIAVGTSAVLAAAVPGVTIAAAGNGNQQASDVNVPGDAHKSPVKANRNKPGGRSNNLTYHGGVGGVGVETGADAVYIVQWGWTSDPSGEATQQQNFFQGVGGSSWNNSVTQYCQGSVSYGSSTCPSGATFAVNPALVYSQANLWKDDINPLPGSITQSALATEAVNAAAHFGNTTASSNTTAEYIIDTPTGHSTSGFGTQFCAWHSSTSSTSYGNVAYTNFPYQTDAGTACGQNFVNAGSAGLLDGVTIVGGHEFAETETDIFPNGGWLDSNGRENGDKCAWISSGQGASTNVTLATGTFAVQSLWSNSFNSGAGGCVTSYP